MTLLGIIRQRYEQQVESRDETSGRPLSLREQLANRITSRGRRGGH